MPKTVTRARRRAPTASRDRSPGRRRGRCARPTASADSCQFHIIQAVVVWKYSVSSGRRSPCSRCSLTCSSSVPPAPWTMHLGGAGGAGREHDEQRVVERQPRSHAGASAGPPSADHVGEAGRRHGPGRRQRQRRRAARSRPQRGQPGRPAPSTVVLAIARRGRAAAAPARPARSGRAARRRPCPASAVDTAAPRAAAASATTIVRRGVGRDRAPCGRRPQPRVGERGGRALHVVPQLGPGPAFRRPSACTEVRRSASSSTPGSGRSRASA